MTVLVTAASNHGATAEIAARISADLAERGVAVELKKLDELRDLSNYDAFVVGSGIYFGQWLKPAKKFIESHQRELSRRPTWLFSSGPIVGDPPTAGPEDTARGDAFAETVHAREHKVFAGKLDERDLSWCEKIAVRRAHAREGDYRDWQAIDEWAASIGRDLQPMRPLCKERAMPPQREAPKAEGVTSRVRVAALLLIVGLLAGPLGTHVYWALGGTWGLHQSTSLGIRVVAVVVIVLLVAAVLVVLARVRLWQQTFVSDRVIRFFAWALAGVFLVETLGAFTWSRAEPEWWLYGPVSLVIALLALIVARSGAAWRLHRPHRTLSPP